MAKKKKARKKKPAKPIRVKFYVKPKQAQPADQPEITPHPTAGPKVTEFEQKLDEQLAGGEPKRGPGRPRTKPGITPEPEGIPIDMVAGTIKLPFELWSIGQGVKELALTDIEARQMAGPVKQLLDYYLPQIPAIAYAWVGLSVSSFWIMRSRLLLIAELKKQREAESAGPEAGPNAMDRKPGRTVPPSGPVQGIDQSKLKTQKL